MINDPASVAELEVAFLAYERALLANDNVTLLGFFFDDPTTTRYGVAEVQQGFAEIAAFRRGERPFSRELYDTIITTYGNDYGVVATLFRRPDLPDAIGRQMQTWLRTNAGWKVVAAHVSMMPVST
jgi:hypothetical protein